MESYRCSRRSRSCRRLEADVGEIRREDVYLSRGDPIGVECSNHPFDVVGRKVESLESGGDIVFRAEPALLAGFDGSPVLRDSFSRDLDQTLAIVVAVSAKGEEQTLRFIGVQGYSHEWTRCTDGRVVSSLSLACPVRPVHRIGGAGRLTRWGR